MYLIQTVQTTWRPQLPLPKELQTTNEQRNQGNGNGNDNSNSNGSDNYNNQHQQNEDDDVDDITKNRADFITNDDNINNSNDAMDRLRKDNNNSSLSGNSTQLSNKQKWSFGRLFRKKKEIEESESSSEEDRKAGFVPAQKYGRGSNAASNGNVAKSKPKHKSSNRNNKVVGGGFDHIVVSPNAQSNARQPHIDNEFFLPVETVPPAEPYYQNQQQFLQYQQQLPNPQQQQPNSRSTNSLDRRAALHGARSTAAGAGAHTKSRSAQRLPHDVGSGVHISSDEEIISLNSSTFSKYRSDESIHSGGQAMQPGQSRRSRAARNERYLKRLSRDGEPSHGGVPVVVYAQPPVQRWKTQPVPLSIYQAPQQLPQRPPTSTSAQQQLVTRLRNTSSLQNVAPYVHWNQMQQQLQQQQRQQQQLTKGLQNTVNDGKRSISYDSQIHLQNVNGRLQTKPLPPPPPPRDPLRRVHVSHGQMQNGSSGDLRPVSYAFDHCGVPVLPATSAAAPTKTGGMGGRCVSDDRIWQSQTPLYQSVHSLNMPPPPVQQTPTNAGNYNRRFITRAERNANPAKKSLPNGIDFHYVADATPRSRKPIHLLEPSGASDATKEPPPSSGILRTTKSGLPAPAASTANEYWQRSDAVSQAASRGRTSVRTPDEPVPKPRSISSSRLSEFRSYPIPMYSEVQKPHRKAQPAHVPDNVVHGSLHIKAKPNTTDNYVEIRHKDVNKSNSMPHYYQRRSGEVPLTPNKYEEYVAEKREQHAQAPIFTAAPEPQSHPQPQQRKASEPQIYFPRKKPANLEEAINELEAIYKSLGLTEEPEKRERVPTPSEFEKFALAHADEYDDEESPTGEPDLVRDDVAYRNLQLANLQHKTAEKQPPFGIPVGPIVPAPQSDYLHVTPDKHRKKSSGSPDIVKDDLAVRALRKEPAGSKQQIVYPAGVLQKKHRATRTQSANIYNLIQRDAAKPSGGDLYSFMELSRTLDRAGSMSDIRKDESAKDIPATLDLLRKLKAQDEQLEKHQAKQEEQEQLKRQQAAHKKVHIPFRHPSQGGAICQLPQRLTSGSGNVEPQKAPVPLPRKTLTPEPILGNYQMEDALNKIAQDAQESSIKLSKELQELRKEALITASRPKLNAEQQKLEQELQEIEAVSEAAKRCGKMLLDTLPDTQLEILQETSKPNRKLHKEVKLIKAIDQVSEAANAVCEKILKDIVTTEPPVIVQEAIKVKQPPEPPQTTPPTESTTEQPLVMPNLIKKLDPIQSDKIEAIAKRCMRQLSELAENADYDNLAQQPTTPDSACNMPTSSAVSATHKPQANFISTVAEVHQRPRQHAMSVGKRQTLDEIDKIMQECEAHARVRPVTSTGNASATITKHSDVSSADDQRTTAPSMSSSSGSGSANIIAPNASTTASSFSSSSDCLAKSSSPSNASHQQSSSITSFNPYSSSDYIKSPSSEYHAPSTDPIKTFSTTSYEVQSTTSATPNITSLSSGSNNPNTAHTANSTFSYTPSPSPPLNLTPVSARRSTAIERARSSSPSQYNSSEELAMIFGIEEQPKQRSKSLSKSGKTKVGHSTASITTTNTMPAPIQAANTKLEAAEAAHIAAFATAIAPEQVLTTTTNSALRVNFNKNDDVHIDLDVDVDVDEANNLVHVNDVTSDLSSTNTASSASNCSSYSFKLATIPELSNEHDAEMEAKQQSKEHHEDLKLSSNFNKIFASKISIIVDRQAERQPPQRSELAAVAHAPITQFDSLSSLDDTSSNPDSGNVSLADFPLIAHTNTTLELQTSYNSRFEVKESYVTEVSISTDNEEISTESAMDEDADFPRLPTEEELIESLREEGDSTEDDISCEKFDAAVGVSKPNVKKESDLGELEKGKDCSEDLGLSEQKTEVKQQSAFLENFEEIEQAMKLDEAFENSEIFDKLDESSNKINEEFDRLLLEQQVEIDDVLQIDESSLAESELNETPLLLLPLRRKSIVYETPQLNMNISELKLKHERSKVNVVDGKENEVPDAAGTQARNEVKADTNDHVDDDDDDDDDDADKSINEQQLATLLRQRKQAPAAVIDDEQPCTSSKALSIFGEVRPVRPTAVVGIPAAAAATAHNLTTLEHVLVACTVGLITTNDLLTLFLIIIGVIIIIAIALY